MGGTRTGRPPARAIRSGHTLGSRVAVRSQMAHRAGPEYALRPTSGAFSSTDGVATAYGISLTLSRPRIRPPILGRLCADSDTVTTARLRYHSTAEFRS